MAATTANDLIRRAMTKARVISPGADIPAGKGAQMLLELNDLLESWALEKLMVIADVLESFTFTAGTAEYTYGTGGTFDSARPIEIKDECLVRSGGTDYQCRLLTLDAYRRRGVKTTSGRPRMMTYNPTYPLMAILFWPTPDTTDDVHIRAAKTVASFATGATAVDLAPGYRRAIVANLALEINPNFGKKDMARLVISAKESKRNIKSANAVPVKPMTTPDLRLMAGGHYGGTIDNPFI